MLQHAQQIVAGKANVGTAAACGIYAGARYLVYASAGHCLVYNGYCEFVQVLRDPEDLDGTQDVTAVCMRLDGAEVAVGYNTKVLLFRPRRNDERISWVLTATLQQDYTVRALSWGGQGQLLVAGKRLTIWEQPKRNSAQEVSEEGLRLVWSVELAAEAVAAEFSPDADFFSTYGADDPLVKIWYQNRQEGSGGGPTYDFCYLPHPRTVVNVEWRKTSEKRWSVEDNILKTISTDNICRFWAPMTVSEPYRFDLRVTIDPCDFPLTEDVDAASPRHTCHIHWLDTEEIKKAVHAEQRTGQPSTTDSGRAGSTLLKSQKVLDTVKDYPDMLFHIQSDGSMVVWAVQGLTGQPRRIPKVLVVMKNVGTVPQSDFGFFTSKVIVYHSVRNDKHYPIVFPAEVQIFGQRGDGAMRCYTMNLDDFFATSWIAPRLALKHAWDGPRKVTKRFWRHPNMNLMACAANTEEVVVFRTVASHSGLKATDALTAAANIPISTTEIASTSVVWLPNGPFAMVHDKTLRIHQVQDAGHLQLGVLPGLVSEKPLLLLEAMYDPSGTTTPDNRTVHVIALTDDATVFIWAVSFVNSSFQSSDLVSCKKLPLPTSTQVVFAAATDVMASVYYPYSPLGAHLFLTYSSDSHFRFWNTADGCLSSISASSEDYWEMVAEFESKEEIELMAASAFGKLCTVVNKDGMREVTVWSNESTGLAMRKEWSVMVGDEVLGLDWYFSSGGQHLLAVARSNRIQVYCQIRLSNVDDSPSWTSTRDIDLDRSNPAVAISWLTNGSLLVATEFYMSVYEKWLDSREPADATGPQQLFSMVAELNGRLPDHHPQLLLQYLLWGKFAFVEYSLSLLYHFIKLMVENNVSITWTPLPLWKVFSDNENDKKIEPQYDALFSFGEDDMPKVAEVGVFGEEQAAYVTDQLTRISLPGTTGPEQMALVAIIDTLVQVEKQRRSLDENGVRYLLFLRFFLFSQKSFPPPLRPKEVTTRDIAWAYYSDSQDMFVDFLHQCYNNKFTWPDAKATGLGFWLRSPDALRRTMETIARNQYIGKDDTRNPVDCALFYLALRKKNVLLGLWKLANSHPEQPAMLRFLSNDFEDERWKSAALKNAFALLGKQRYEYAVAFFLLADKLKDAVNVCLKQLNDMSLAIVICRLYEGEDGPVLLETLRNQLLPRAIEADDRWLATVLFTMLKRRDKAIFALMMPLTTLCESDESIVTTAIPHRYLDPSLLVLYSHLRRTYKGLRIPQPRVPLDMEVEFVYRSSQTYERLGAPALALHVISTADTVVGQYSAEEDHAAARDTTHTREGLKSNVMGTITATSAKDTDLDWGAPVSAVKRDDDGGFDWGAPSTTTSTAGAFDWGEPVAKAPANEEDEYEAFKRGLGGSGGDSLGYNWGDSEITSGSATLDDEYEAFKKELGGKEDGFLKDELNEVEASDAELEINSPGVGITPVDGAAALRLAMENRNVKLYNWMLTMRVIQAAYKSATVISINRHILKVEPTFRDYFNLLRDGIRDLCSLVNMPEAVMDRILDMRCREMDALLAFVEIIPFKGNLLDYVDSLEQFLVDECTILARLTMGNVDEIAFDYGLGESLARRMLWFLVRWRERTRTLDKASLSNAVFFRAAATSFLCLALSSIRGKRYTTLYWLVGFCDRFFDALLAGHVDILIGIISDLLSPRPPVQHPHDESMDQPGERAGYESDPDEDDFEESSSLRKQDPGTVALFAESLMNTIALQHIGLTFDAYLAQLGNGTSSSVDESHIFLRDVILRRIIQVLYEMQARISQDQVTGGIKIDKVPKYLHDEEIKHLWSLLRRTVNIPIMLQLIRHASEQDATRTQPSKLNERGARESADSFEHVEKEDTKALVKPELIYRTKHIIHSLALNPLHHDDMVVGTHQLIQEVHIARAMRSFARRGTFSEIRTSVDDLALRSSTGSASSDRETLVLLNDKPPEPRTKSLRKQDKMSRNLSFDSMQKALKKNLNSFRRESPLSNIADEAIAESVSHTVRGVASLTAHPSLNYYLAGASDPPTTPAAVQLFQFGQRKGLVTYSTGTNTRLTSCKFDPFGSRFVAGDSRGDLFLWKFDASAQALSPTASFECHSSSTNGVTFLGCTSLLATCGTSADHMNVCFWDTLLPTSKARVKAFTVNEGGAYSITYSARHQLLFSGGKKGDICVYDTRQRALVDTFQAHGHMVKSLGIDENSNCLISGSMGGEVKLWDLGTFQERINWRCEASGTDGSPSTERSGALTYGVMQIDVVDSTVYTCGADGCVRRYRIPEG
ncbi:RAVE protein 1 C terminal-domain-containing protein [Gaertneriomyces semiglobifer]|nr:RAVE protein 1 C terminal-domain-containing protein [Gaertneriomyces semiglobifer]